MKQTTSYTFKYETDYDSIDINTLLLSQIHFGTVFNEIKNEIAPDANLKIKIKPIEKGSILCDFIIDLSWIETALHWANSHTNEIQNIVTTLVGLLTIRKEFGGKKPTEVIMSDDKIVIKNGDTSIEITKEIYKLYMENAAIDQALKKGFEAIEKDEEVKGVKILDEKKESIISIERDDFGAMVKTNEVFEDVTQISNEESVALTIFKVVFDKGYKWQFYMNGRKISAYVKDENFMQRINNGERFAKGDTLIVEMDVKKVLDTSMDIYIEDEFVVTKVINHVQRPEQTKLDFDNGKEK